MSNAMKFAPATKKQSRLRMAILGPSGSGKTYTALRMAQALANGGAIAVIDTERGSASKYAGEAPDGPSWQFDVLELTAFNPDLYTQAIEMASRAGYAVLIIDSLSHAWSGKDGALELKDRIGGNDWAAWRKITPMHDRMIDAILQSPCHVIVTMRSKMDYVQETDEKGKTVIRKVGMAPVQRPGMEYEFDIVLDMDWSHIGVVSKSRCSAVADTESFKPGPAFMQPVIEWLNSGAPAEKVARPDPAPATPEPDAAEAGLAHLNDYDALSAAELAAAMKAEPRPWSAPLCAAGIRRRVEQSKNGSDRASAGKRGILVSKLEELLGDNAAMKRHEWLRYVFGVASSKELAVAQCDAVLAWAESEHAAQEAAAMLVDASKRAGQAEMFDAPAPQFAQDREDLDAWFPGSAEAEQAALMPDDGAAKRRAANAKRAIEGGRDGSET